MVFQARMHWLFVVTMNWFSEDRPVPAAMKPNSSACRTAQASADLAFFPQEIRFISLFRRLRSQLCRNNIPVARHGSRLQLGARALACTTITREDCRSNRLGGSRESGAAVSIVRRLGAVNGFCRHVVAD